MTTIKEQCQDILTIQNKQYSYFSLDKLQQNLGVKVNKLPYTIKILLENVLRNYDNQHITEKDLKNFDAWLNNSNLEDEISFKPARVLLQDFTGVPAVVDLAAMRTRLEELGHNPELVDPVIPVDLVIDHSIQVDQYGRANAIDVNTKAEVKRNQERYKLLKWAQKSFNNFRVVPPGTGICHQVNLEYFAKVVWQSNLGNETILYPDTLVGTDSHTTMINGLGVLGWGVGGIEAESAMLGQAIPMNIPKVVGVKLLGNLNPGITATDLVLTVTEMLRNHGVVGKFVEFYGPGLQDLTLADRATISNMSPEYGATCGYFPVDEKTVDYMQFTGRDEQLIEIVKEYTKAQGLWRDDNYQPTYTEQLELDLNSIRPSVAGPYRPQDRIDISKLPESLTKELEKNRAKPQAKNNLQNGDVVIAAITSCTNTSNPHVLIAAGLLAQNAVTKGLTVKPWVKTSLAPGSKVVTEYLEKTNLQQYLDQLGFNLVAYGCTTCIGNSGPLPDEIKEQITNNNLLVSSVLSGNRNFAGRINPHTKLSWLASPPLVVAYALAGTMNIDLTSEPLGQDQNNNNVYLKDIWPSNQEINAKVQQINKEMFIQQYANVFQGDTNWSSLQATESTSYNWDDNSTYVRKPNFLQKQEIADIKEAKILAVFGDTITTDHISPAGAIPEDSPTGKYLMELGINSHDFNSYGTRRGNHEVMARASFSNIRIRNEMVPEKEGGFTKYFPSKEVMSIYDASMSYQMDNTPLVVIAGKEYGTGSSRDWAAKGTRMLGIKVVIAESYERIHRSNLIGMGVLPLQFDSNTNRKSLQLTGEETFTINGIKNINSPKTKLTATIHYPDGKTIDIELLSRIDTQKEVLYFQNNGILNYVLSTMIE